VKPERPGRPLQHDGYGTGHPGKIDSAAGIGDGRSGVRAAEADGNFAQVRPGLQ
jgi:hypothetical protein